MDDKRLAIEIAAEKLFAQRGFRATSIRDIAKAAQVSSAMISYYFGSKEQLLTAIMQRSIRTLNEEIIELSASVLPELEQLYSLVDYHTDLILKHGSLMYMLLQEQ